MGADIAASAHCAGWRKFRARRHCIPLSGIMAPHFARRRFGLPGFVSLVSYPALISNVIRRYIFDPHLVFVFKYTSRWLHFQFLRKDCCPTWRSDVPATQPNLLFPVSFAVIHFRPTNLNCAQLTSRCKRKIRTYPQAAPLEVENFVEK